MRAGALLFCLFLFACRSTGTERRMRRVYQGLPELLWAHQDYPAPAVGVFPAPDPAPPPGAGDLEQARKRRVGQAAERVRKGFEEEARATEASVTVDGDRLVIEAPQELQDRARRMLQVMIAEMGMLVHVEVKVLSLAEEDLQELPPRLQRRLDRPAKLDSEDLDRLTALALPDREGRERSRSVTAFNHQQSHTLISSQQALIGDVEHSPVAGEPARPVISVLNTGMMVEVKPALEMGSGRVGLRLKVETAELRGPIGTVMVEGISVSAPDISRLGLEAELDLTAGAWTAAGFSTPLETFGRHRPPSAPPARPATRDLILVRARPIWPAGAEGRSQAE